MRKTRDKKFMRCALALARKGLGMTSPNPAVGAVVVRGEKIVGQGYHHQAGSSHAEVSALRQAGRQAKGAKLYVSLEPCSFYGRTPPCTDAIIKAGIREVIVACLDPNPRVNGKGIRQLKRASIKVKTGILEDEARRLNEGFQKFIRSEIPFVTLKLGQSLDGKIATRSGDSRWITGTSARRLAHRLRRENDAVVVGINTILKDDPLLTSRRSGRQPLKVILDTGLKTPRNARVFSNRSPAPTIIATTKNPGVKKSALLKKNVEILVFSQKKGKVNLRELLAELGRRDVVSVLVEGGGKVAASFLAEKLVDKLLFFIAPIIIGGRDGISAVGGEGVRKISQALKLKDITLRRVGKDWLFEAYPDY